MPYMPCDECSPSKSRRALNLYDGIDSASEEDTIGSNDIQMSVSGVLVYVSRGEGMDVYRYILLRIALELTSERALKSN